MKIMSYVPWNGTKHPIEFMKKWGITGIDFFLINDDGDKIARIIIKLK